MGRNQPIQLRRSQKMDALGKLTGGIAHDFNNMLGVIIGFAELLEASSAADDTIAAEYTRQILTASERARKLTIKLLGFSRKETSDLAVANINSLLQGEREMLQKTITVRIQLNMDLQKDLWPVYLDKDGLEDAIINMSINSMHAMPEKGMLTFITRNVTCGHQMVNMLDMKQGDYVLLSVVDTGCGMDNETLQHVFEPFFTTKKEKGTGLGLSQVYGFVQRSKGSIQVYSAPGEGTRIDIYFPRYLLKVNETEVVSNAESNDDMSGNATILVVDDEEALRMLQKEILSGNGYKVLLAEDGKKALSILEKSKVDLVLTDVIMPGMTGYELAEKITQLYPSVKIQIISGYSNTNQAEAYEKTYYENRMLKPFSPRKLLQRVQQLLNESESQL